LINLKNNNKNQEGFMSNGSTLINDLISVWKALGSPSYISAALLAAIIDLYRKSRIRNKYIDGLMKMTPIDSKEFNSTIQSIREVLETKIEGLNQRLDDLISMIESLNSKK